MAPDEGTIRSFLEVLVAGATAALDGGLNGVLQVTRKHRLDDDLLPVRYSLGASNLIDEMVQAATADSEAGFNVYIEGRFVRSDLKGKKRGELKDTMGVFALVVDSDADKDMAWIPPIGVRPTLSVETSPGNAQYWFFFKRAIPPVRAQRLGEGLRRLTGGDFDTGNPVQPYRIPGTVNYPDKAKIARGRVVTPTLFLGASP